MIINYNLSKTQISAIDNDQILGYIDLVIPDDYSGGRNLEIQYVYVDPDFRRNHIATQMLEFLLKNTDAVWISLWTSRECELDKSFNLYKHIGFSEKVYLEDYYENGIGTRYFIKKMKYR